MYKFENIEKLDTRNPTDVERRLKLFNSIQEEICSVIEAAGLAVDGSTYDQLHQAILRFLDTPKKTYKIGFLEESQIVKDLFFDPEKYLVVSFIFTLHEKLLLSDQAPIQLTHEQRITLTFDEGYKRWIANILHFEVKAHQDRYHNIRIFHLIPHFRDYSENGTRIEFEPESQDPMRIYVSSLIEITPEHRFKITLNNTNPHQVIHLSDFTYIRR